jgi:hypothetical protein
MFLAWKADNSVNFTAFGFVNCGTHHNSFHKDKNKHRMTSYVMVYKAKTHAMLPHMRELSLACTLVA